MLFGLFQLITCLIIAVRQTKRNGPVFAFFKSQHDIIIFSVQSHFLTARLTINSHQSPPLISFSFFLNHNLMRVTKPFNNENVLFCCYLETFTFTDTSHLFKKKIKKKVFIYSSTDFIVSG